MGTLVREVTLYIRKMGECTAEQVYEHFEDEETVISIRNAIYAARKKGWVEVASKTKIPGQSHLLVKFRYLKMDEAESITKIAILNRKPLELAWSNMLKVKPSTQKARL